VDATCRRWWDDERLEQCNGVFQGGGAKGLAYAGALRAFREEGYWFGAVAGSSAGALTATMIAAGFSPDRMPGLSSGALAATRRPRFRSEFKDWRSMWAQHLFGGMFGTVTPLFPTNRLQHWVETRLREQYEAFMGVRWAGDSDIQHGHDDVTFAALAEATGIELFIVALDVSGGVPIVLSKYSAPNSQVSSAAVASSSIPFFLPKRHLLLASSEDTWSVVDVVDGGAWANYPRFVFADGSFAVYHGIPSETLARPTVGFVLKTLPADEAVRPSTPVRIGRFVSRSLATASGPLVLLPVGDADPGADREPPSTIARQTSSDEGPQLIDQKRRQPHINQSPDRLRSAIAASSAMAVLILLVLAFWFGWWAVAAAGLALAPTLIFWRKRLARAFLRMTLFAAQNFLTRVTGVIFVAISLVVAIVYSPEWAPAILTPLPNFVAAYVIYVAVIAGPFVIAASALVVLGVVLFHSPLAEDAPRVANASLGAATRVPPWVGADSHSEWVIRVPVDPPISTLAFSIDEDTAKMIIGHSHRAALAQLRARKEGRLAGIHGPQRIARWPSLEELMAARGIVPFKEPEL
jgi:predicted acylesterase/phospholipase RssA